MKKWWPKRLRDTLRKRPLYLEKAIFPVKANRDGFYIKVESYEIIIGIVQQHTEIHFHTESMIDE